MYKPKILLVEDDRALSNIVTEYLALHSYEVIQAMTGSDLQVLLEHHSFNLVLLDLNLPDTDGLALLKHLREKNSVLVFVLSGRQDEDSRYKAYELGADDFISKPYSAKELELKMRNALMRQGVLSNLIDSTCILPNAEPIIFEGWALCPERLCVKFRNLPEVHLTKAEFELLALLFRENGSIVSRRKILSHLKVTAEVYSDETITTLIYRLRSKMSKVGLSSPIKTVSGMGYRLTSD